MNKSKNIHSGHRERLRQNVKQNDIYTLNDVNYLEYLLTFVRPRVDTNPIAHALLDSFISIDGVFNTSEEELALVEGVGPKTAEFLRAVGASTFMRNRYSNQSKIKLDTLSSLKQFIDRVMPPSRNEQFIIINVGKNFIVKNYKIFKGVSHSLINLDSKCFTDYIFAHQTGFFFFAHTHPEHIATPSNSDDNLFEKLVSFANSLSVVMLDNLIFSENDFFSYRYGLYAKYNEYEIDYSKKHEYNLNKIKETQVKKEIKHIAQLENTDSVMDDGNIDF